jgi:ADP-ribose pyrophosphatase
MVTKKLSVLSRDTVFSKFGKKMIHEKLKMKDGNILDWYYLDSSDSVLIVPLTNNNETLLIKQNRFNLRKNVYEFPSGGIVGNLSSTNVEKSAVKELFEETGYIANKIINLGKYYVLPSETNRWVHVYLALGVTKKSEPILDNLIEKYFEIKVKLCKYKDLISGKIIFKGLEHNFALNLAEKYLVKNKLI